MIDLAAWAAQVAKETKGLSPDELTWYTPEGIGLKVLYTEADIADLPNQRTLPGFAPFIRGPKATMYAGRPWTIRQYAGFSQLRNRTPFIRRRWPLVAREFQLRSILPHIVAMTPITLACPAMSAKLALPSIQSKI